MHPPGPLIGTVLLENPAATTKAPEDHRGRGSRWIVQAAS
jgi:hypothetical protein